MTEASYLSCPACSEPAQQPLEAFVQRPTWQCGCGFTVTLPRRQVEAMIARIERARRLVRFSEAE